MAYCVRCGVKLESGSTACPLCQTKVYAPAEIIGEVGVPLFPKDTTQTSFAHPLLDKNRKGFIELIIAFMAIAVITLIITAFALGRSFSPWLPITYVVLGGSYFLVAFFVKPFYPYLASWYVVLTILLMGSIDIFDGTLSWSYYTMCSLLMYWFVAVLPFWVPKRHRKLSIVGALLVVAAYLLIIDALGGGGLTWSLSIALPTYGVVLFALLFVLLRVRFGKPTITDLVLSVVLATCWGVVAGDFFYLRSVGSSQLLSWSASVFVVAICLLIFLTLTLTLRRVRNYFNNRLV